MYSARERRIYEKNFFLESRKFLNTAEKQNPKRDQDPKLDFNWAFCIQMGIHALFCVFAIIPNVARYLLVRRAKYCVVCILQRAV